MDVSGVLDGHAEKALRATIDLRHGCKGSHGRETESVILAGDDVVNKTLPVILCDEDDVAGRPRCHHRLDRPRADRLPRRPRPRRHDDVAERSSYARS
jgi:hypothetical protein